MAQGSDLGGAEIAAMPSKKSSKEDKQGNRDEIDAESEREELQEMKVRMAECCGRGKKRRVA